MAEDDVLMGKNLFFLRRWVFGRIYCRQLKFSLAGPHRAHHITSPSSIDIREDGIYFSSSDMKIKPIQILPCMHSIHPLLS